MLVIPDLEKKVGSGRSQVIGLSGLHGKTLVQKEIEKNGSMYDKDTLLLLCYFSITVTKSTTKTTYKRKCWGWLMPPEG